MTRPWSLYLYPGPALAGWLGSVTMIIILYNGIDPSHRLYQQGEDELEILFLAKSQFRERKPHHVLCADMSQQQSARLISLR